MKIFIFTILLGTFLIASQADAVWVYEDKFNSDTKSTGNLHGQDGWDGSTAWQVITGTKFEGDQGLSCASGADAYISRAITGVTAGKVYGAMMVSTLPGSTSDFRFIVGAWTMYTSMLASGKIAYQVSGTGYVDFMSYSANQWYIIEMEFDDAAQDNKYRVNVYDVDAETWGTQTGWVASGAYTAITSVGMYGDTLSGYTGYFDMITPTNPFPVASDTCTCPTDGTDWYVHSSDNCYLSASCDLDDGWLYVLNTGTGSFNIVESAVLAVAGVEATSTEIIGKIGSEIIIK